MMIYVFGDYTLDTGRHELRRGEMPCPIEPQGYDVLLYLIHDRDRVVSKQEFLDHVWPETFVSEVAQYNRLRSAHRSVGDTGRVQRVTKALPKQGYRSNLAVEEREAKAHLPETSDRFVVEAPVYGWFTEGFDTADLKDAKALLRKPEG